MDSGATWRRGFTLLEILVATAMVAVLAGSLYATLRVAFKARSAAVAAGAPTRAVNVAMSMLEEDFRAAVPAGGVLAGPFDGEDGTDLLGDASDTVTLFRSGRDDLAAPGVGDIRMVTFVCEDAEDGQGRILKRQVTTNLLAPQTAEPREEVLCRNVRAFDVQYFDGLEWSDDWDPAAMENALPLAVEVLLEIGDASPDSQGSFARSIRVFQIPCGLDASLAADEAAQSGGQSGS